MPKVGDLARFGLEWFLETLLHIKRGNFAPLLSAVDTLQSKGLYSFLFLQIKTNSTQYYMSFKNFSRLIKVAKMLFPEKPEFFFKASERI